MKKKAAAETELYCFPAGLSSRGYPPLKNAFDIVGTNTIHTRHECWMLQTNNISLRAHTMLIVKNTVIKTKKPRALSRWFFVPEELRFARLSRYASSVSFPSRYLQFQKNKQGPHYTAHVCFFYTVNISLSMLCCLRSYL
jgi:hypothetical protein